MSKITNSAKGQDCTVMIPGVCRNNTETTVLAHIRDYMTGMKQKPPDWQGAFCCHLCHVQLDGQVPSDYSPRELKLMHYEGMVKTLRILIAKGLIEVK